MTNSRESNAGESVAVERFATLDNNEYCPEEELGDLNIPGEPLVVEREGQRVVAKYHGRLGIEATWSMGEWSVAAVRYLVYRDPDRPTERRAVFGPTNVGSGELQQAIDYIADEYSADLGGVENGE